MNTPVTPAPTPSGDVASAAGRFRRAIDPIRLGVALGASALFATDAWEAVMPAAALLAASAIIFAYFVVRSRSRLFGTRSRTAVTVAGFAVTAILAVGEQAIGSAAAVESLATALIGWSIVLGLVYADGRGGAGERARPIGGADGSSVESSAAEAGGLNRDIESPPAAPPSRVETARIERFVALIVLGTFVLLAVLTRIGARWFAIDEVVYLLQARLFAEGEYVWSWGGLPDRFFALPLHIPVEGGAIPHFPPGFAALLAPALALGVAGALPPLLGAAGVLLTYALGRSLGSPLAGAIAATLLATQFYFLNYASSYFSHHATIVATSAAALALSKAYAATGRPRFVLALLAGLLLGAATAVRPLTGLTLGVSIWLWLALRKSIDLRTLGRVTSAAVIGASVPLAGLLYYNTLTTGSPWTLGYTAAHGEWAALGFGERGFMLFDAAGSSVPALIDFTPATAARNLLSTLRVASTWLLPFGLILPLLWVGFLRGFSYRAREILPFVLLPLAHFFFYANGLRYHLELLPFVYLGVAAVLVHLARVRPRAGVTLFVLLVLSNVGASSVRLAVQAERERDGYSGSGFPYVEQVEEARERFGTILVFVRNPPLSEPIFIGLSRYNALGFPGDVIVARDLGTENAGLLARFPDHVPFVASWPSGAVGAGLVPLSEAPD